MKTHSYYLQTLQSIDSLISLGEPDSAKEILTELLSDFATHLREHLSTPGSTEFAFDMDAFKQDLVKRILQIEALSNGNDVHAMKTSAPSIIPAQRTEATQAKPAIQIPMAAPNTLM